MGEIVNSGRFNHSAGRAAGPLELNQARAYGEIRRLDHRISLLEDLTERRRRPKAKVVNTHKCMVKAVYDGKCPCCMKPLKDPEIDHFSSRAWGGLHDTWLVCSQCNRDLYHGNLIRAEILPRFTTYQSHLKSFIGGEQLNLIPETEREPYLSILRAEDPNP